MSAIDSEIVWDLTDLSTLEKACLAFLVTKANRNHGYTVWWGQQRVADRTGMARKSVTRCLKMLEERGYLTRESQFYEAQGQLVRRGSDRMTVHMDRIRTDAESARTARAWDSQSHAQGQTVPSEGTQSPSRTREKNPGREPKDTSDADAPDTSRAIERSTDDFVAAVQDAAGHLKGSEQHEALALAVDEHLGPDAAEQFRYRWDVPRHTVKTADAATWLTVFRRTMARREGSAASLHANTWRFIEWKNLPCLPPTPGSKTPRPPATPVLPSPTATAYGDLLGAIGDAVNAGHPVPCLGANGHLWTSEDQQEQQCAAEGCTACPVLGACWAYARDAKERGAVWGGKVRRPLTPKNRTTTTDIRSVR